MNIRGKNTARRVVEAVRLGQRHAVESLLSTRHPGNHIPLHHENWRYQHFLMPTYLDYVSRVSWADHAVSLPTAACLLQMAEKVKARRLLDTGSGYSSYVLRRYAATCGAEVVSVDDDPEWMKKTAGYLEETGVGADGLMTLSDFTARDHEPFDLIFHDMGNFTTRVSTLPRVSALIADAGYLIYDDVQVESVRDEALRVTARAGRRYLSMRHVTVDEINRYSGLSVGL